MVQYGYSLVQIWYDLTYYLFPEEQIVEIPRNQDVFDHENWFQNYHRLYKGNFRRFSVGIPVFSIHQRHYDQTHFEMNLAAEFIFYEFCKNQIFVNFSVREKKIEILWNDEIKHVTRWNEFFCVLGKSVFWVWDFYLTGKSIWFWFISSYQKWTRFRFTYRMGLCPSLKFQMSHEWVIGMSHRLKACLPNFVAVLFSFDLH